MGFGFGDDGSDKENTGPKEIEHNIYDTLRWQKWNSLEVGQRVKSVITGTEGVISVLHDNWKCIEIDWDNGKKSKVNHRDLIKVILVPVV
jgi:hypothetical protein